MADRNLTFRVGAKDDASTTFSKIAQASKREMGKVQKDLDDTASKGKQMAQVLESMADELDDEFRKTEQAAERLGDALGPELRAKVDPEQIIGDFRRAGLTFEEIEADAEQLAAAIKKVDDVSERAGAGIKRSMGNAADGLDRVRDSGDQSRSVMANMAGNATSELPGIGTALGPVNVAMGQLAEYAADGNIKLKNLIALGGGMAVLGVATSVVASHFAKVAKADAFSKDKIEGWVDAMREGASLTEAVVDGFKEAGKVEVEIFDNIVDITPGLAELGLTVENFVDLTKMSQEELAAWAASMEAAGAPADYLRGVVMAAAAEHDDLADAEKLAAANAVVFGESTKASASEMQAAADAGDRYREALEELNEAQDAALGNNISLAEAMLNTADSLDEYTATMQDAEASDRDKQQAGLNLISTMQQEAEAAGRSAYDQAVASGNAAGAQEASTRAQIDSLFRLAQNLAPGSYLRQQIEDHIRALASIPAVINTTVKVNTNYGQGTIPIPVSGKFAEGGRPTPGMPAIVGEEGPELFVPDRPGTVIAAGDTARVLDGGLGSPSVTFHIENFNVSTPVDAHNIGSVLMDSLRQYVQRNGNGELSRLVT